MAKGRDLLKKQPSLQVGLLCHAHRSPSSVRPRLPVENKARHSSFSSPFWPTAPPYGTVKRNGFHSQRLEKISIPRELSHPKSPPDNTLRGSSAQRAAMDYSFLAFYPGLPNWRQEGYPTVQDLS